MVRAHTIKYSEIKSRFFRYLSEKTNTDVLELEEKSIFSYSDELSDFLSSKYGIKSSSVTCNVKDLLAIITSSDITDDENNESDISENEEIPEEEYIEDGVGEEDIAEETGEDIEENEEQSNDKEGDINSFFLECINDFMNNEDIRKAIGADTDGQLDTDKIDDFIKMIVGNDGNSDDISLTDLEIVLKQITDGAFCAPEDDTEAENANEETAAEVEAALQAETDAAAENEAESEIEAETEATKETQHDNQTNNATSYTPSSSIGGSIGGYNSGNSESVSNVETLESLKKLKTEKQTELNNSRDTLKTIYEQGHTEVNNAKEEYLKSVQNDEKIDNDLKKEQEENSQKITEKEKEIGSLKSELIDTDANIANYNSAITAKTSEISALKTALSNLEARSAASGEIKEKIEQKKTEIKEKIDNANKALEEAKKNLDKANERKTELESQISEKEKELSDLNNAKSEIESKILASCSDTTKEALTNYQDLQKALDEAIVEAQKSIDALQKEINEIDKKINEKEANKIQTENTVTKLNKTYNYNGEEFLSLLSQNELDEFLKDEYDAGNYNKNGNCDAMSYKYCEDIMAKLGVSGQRHDLMSDDKAVIEQKAKEALDNGYPVILHVNTKAGTRHFAAATGYRIANNGEIIFLLADNVQGVGITACGTGERRHMITGYSTPYADQNYGYRVIYYE